MDNKTAHNSSEYDEEVVKTIPYYNNFHKETLELIKAYKPNCSSWLDIGCGTGVLIEKACEEFPKTSFILSDISEAMINIAKDRLTKGKVNFLNRCSSEEIKNKVKEKVEVITAIQVNHYLKPKARELVTKNCYDLLKEDGIYVTFENIKPSSEVTINLQLKLWGEFQLESGKCIEDVNKHIERFDKSYFPITISEHLQLLSKVGFRYYEVFWVSKMQCGIYAIK